MVLASINIGLATTGLEHASASLESIASAFDPRKPVGDGVEAFVELISVFTPPRGDARDLFRCEIFGNAASGAIELVSLNILPTKRYLELVSAIASERDDVTVVLSHGWPILSVAVPTTTVSEAVGESIPDGGAAA